MSERGVYELILHVKKEMESGAEWCKTKEVRSLMHHWDEGVEGLEVKVYCLEHLSAEWEVEEQPKRDGDEGEREMKSYKFYLVLFQCMQVSVTIYNTCPDDEWEWEEDEIHLVTPVGLAQTIVN